MKSASSTTKPPVIDADTVHQQIQGLVSASMAWIQTHWLQILVAVAVGAAIVIALHAARRLGQRLCDRSSNPTAWRTIFGRAIVRTGNFFMVMVAAKLVAGYAGAPGEVATTINFLFTVAAVFQAAIWAREIILGGIEHRTASEHYSGEAIGSAMGIIRLLVTFALFAIALIVVLDNLNVNVSGLIAGLGVGGIAIGLAAQGIFADLFAALAIIFDRPFRRGDTVNYGTITGKVERIGLKSTRVRASTGEERVISNKNLLDKEIQNSSRRNYRRGKLTLSLLYETAPDLVDRVPAILEEIVGQCGLKFVRAGFVNFAANAIEVELEFDSQDAAMDPFFHARHKVGVAVLRRFTDEGIFFANPSLAHTPAHA